MSDAVNLPVDEEALDDPTAVPVRVARIWKRHRPASEGSLATSLKAMDVLYDAGEPLTREELERRLIPRLDPYERAYLEAWYRRERQAQQDYHAKRANKPTPPIFEPDNTGSNIEPAVHRWITRVFLARLTGRTLERTADGKLQPGVGTPVVLRMDGRRVPYTCETRQDLAQEDRALHQQYLADLELSELFQRLHLPTQAARAQLLYLLVRRLLIGFKTDGRKFPLDERLVSPQLNRLVALADTSALQRAVLQRAFDAIWTAPTITERNDHDA